MVLITIACLASSSCIGGSKDSGIGSIMRVNYLATWKSPSSDQSPNQSITHLLNKAGDEAVLFEKSGLEGFIVKTT